MAKRKRAESGGGADWLGTYSDMVTLLLCFFILLFSMAEVEASKWEAFVQAFSRTPSDDQLVINNSDNVDGDNIGGANHGTGPAVDINTAAPEDFDELYYFMQKYIEENGLEGSVEIEAGENSVFIRFKDNIFFNPDGYDLRQDSMPLLHFLGDCLKSVEDELLAIRINGHTAAVEYTDYPVSDRRLSSNRADSVAIFLEETKGLEGKKIIAMGYGKNFPTSDNDTPEGRAKNRRVDMMIMSNKNIATDDEQLYDYLQGLIDIETLVDNLNSAEVMQP